MVLRFTESHVCFTSLTTAYRPSTRLRNTIEANILVSRDSQKNIVIGKGGSMLKLVGTYAREKLEQVRLKN